VRRGKTVAKGGGVGQKKKVLRKRNQRQQMKKVPLLTKRTLAGHPPTELGVKKFRSNQKKGNKIGRRKGD